MTSSMWPSAFSIQAALLSGLALGVASSTHCAVMCGPLVLTVGRRLGGRSRAAQLRYAVLHHAGRVAVYAALAVPAGLGGQALVLSGFGRALALVAGGLLLAAAASALRLPFVDRVTSRVSAGVARAFTPVLRWASTRPIAGPLAAGALNGLLPCGLVYAALTAAAAAGSVPAAMLLMAGFGAGTSAVLIAIAVGSASISASMRTKLRPIGPVVLAVTALILIARGSAQPHPHGTAAPQPAAAHLHR